MVFYRGGVRIDDELMSTTGEMGIPEAAERDPNALELLRVWRANGPQHVSLRVAVWEDPEHGGYCWLTLRGTLLDPMNWMKPGIFRKRYRGDDLAGRLSSKTPLMNLREMLSKASA